MVFFGHKSLDNAVREFAQHYHSERNHQGLGNELIPPVDDLIPRLANSNDENGLVACSSSSSVAQRDANPLNVVMMR